MTNSSAQPPPVPNGDDAAAKKRLREAGAPPILSDPDAPTPPMHLPIVRGGSKAYTEQQDGDDEEIRVYRTLLAAYLKGHDEGFRRYQKESARQRVINEAMLPYHTTDEEGGTSRDQCLRRMRYQDTEMFRFTEGGNGDRFAARFVGHVLCDLTSGRRQWYISATDDPRWLRSTNGAVTYFARLVVDEMRERADELEAKGDQQTADALRAHAKRSDTLSALTNMANLGVEVHGLTVNAAVDFDQRRDLLACRNEVVELLASDIHVRPLTARDMITFDTGTSYRPDRVSSPPVRVTEYLETFIPDTERQRLIFKVLGSMIIGDNRSRLFAIIKGGSTTGKSQLVEAIENALGDYATTAPMSIFRGNQDDKPRPDLINALRRRIVFLSEASSAWELHADRIKDMTGGGTLPARGMHSNEFTNGSPHFTPVLVTNNMPTVKGADGGTRRRILVIEFRNKLQDVEDPNIKERFVNDPEVHEYLLARLVQGYIDAAREGLDDALTAFAFDTAEALEELSHIGKFIQWLSDTEQLTEVPSDEWEAYGAKSSYVKLNDMHERYMYWVKRHGSRQDQSDKLGYTEFNKQLRETRGWESIPSGGLRWLGKQLTPYPPLQVIDQWAQGL